MSYRYDLLIDQGASFALDIVCQDESESPMDLTGYSAAAQIRYAHADPAPAAVFSVVVVPELGVVSLSLGAGQTAALSKPQGFWDCELTAPDGSVQRLAGGRVGVSPEVTK